MRKFALMITFLSILVLSACNATLSQPDNLTVDGYLLTWNEVPGATSYLIMINEDTYETESHSYTIPSTYIGPTTAMVQARANQRVSAFSDLLSFTLPYQLTAPINLSMDGRTLTWDHVINATTYQVMIDDTIMAVSEATYTLPETIIGPVALKVQAVRGEEVSAYSTILNVTLWRDLNYPDNIRQDRDQMSWDAVIDATGYLVRIDGVEDFTTELVYSFDNASTHEIEIKSVGSEEAYIRNSGYSPIFLSTKRLDTPINLRIDGRTLTWDHVVNATAYQVMIDDTIVAVSEATYTLSETIIGPVALKVQAVRGEEESAFSATLSTTFWRDLNYPDHIRQDMDHMHWDAVTDALGYLIRIDGVEDYTTELTYPIDIASTHEIMILSVGNEDAYIRSSGFSPPFQSLLRLETPSEIRIESGAIRFEGDTRATGFILVIDGGQDIVLEGMSYAHISMFQGERIVTVRAIHEGGNYLDSALAQTTLNFPVVSLNTVENIVISEHTLTFDPVDHAEAYEIFYKGVSYTTTSATTYPIPSSWLDDSSAYIEIQAHASLYASSPMSLKVYVNVIRITTYSELLALGETGFYVLENDIVATSPWTPKAFSGSFNGQGYEISNLIIDTAFAHTGFFSTLDQATIQNLTLSGEISIISNVNALRVGALAGTITQSVVHNVILGFDIDVTSQNGTGFLGGLAGIIENTDVTATHFSGDITAHFMTTGGLIGKAQNSLASSVITESSFTGEIEVSGSQQTPVGGFIGMFTANSLTISRSFVQADITGSNTVGGFVGYMGTGAIEDCYVQGHVIATSNDFVLLGGFIGRTEGYNVTIRRSIAIVEMASDASGTEVYVGAFVGLTVGGSLANIYEHAHFDNILAPIDRIGNPATGRGDGITGANLASVTSLTGFNPSIWDFSGLYPRLAWES